jgi:hypothetical protein
LLDDTFDKDWLLLDATFSARKTGEKKGISQTDDVVYVSLPWIKAAKPELVQQALVHEAIRNLANAAIAKQEDLMQKKIGDPAARLAIADEFTEALTPVVYQALPAKQLNQTMKDVFKKLSDSANKAMGFTDEMGGFDVVLPAPRDQLYRDLPQAEIKTLVNNVCSGIDGGTQNTDLTQAKIENRLTEVGKNFHDYFHSKVGGPWFLYGDFEYLDFDPRGLDFDPELKALFKFLDDVEKSQGNDEEFKVFQDCQNLVGAKLSLLDDLKKDHGRVQDPLGDRRLDQLPPDDEPGPGAGDGADSLKAQ